MAVEVFESGLNHFTPRLAPDLGRDFGTYERTSFRSFAPRGNTELAEDVA